MQIYSEIQKNPLLHLCITEPLRLGHAEIICENSHGMLLYDHAAHLHILAADDLQTAEGFIQKIRNPYFILSTNASFAPLLESFHFRNTMVCRQYGWLKTEMPEADPRLHIAPPDEAAFQCILENYRMSTPEELTRQKNAGEIFFARDEQGRDVGFVGLHPEGCFGMLQVFPGHRGKGYGAALEKHIIRFLMKSGRVPYCQVDIHNAVSRRLQQKLGLSETHEKLLMAWNDEI